jgi:hypothetical protein
LPQNSEKQITMKFIFIISFFFVSFMASAQVDTISTSQGEKYIGKLVIVKGKLNGIKDFTNRDGDKMYLLDVDGTYPDLPMSIRIFKEAYPTFKYTSADFGKTFYFKGTLESYRDKPSLSIGEPGNVWVK